LNLSTHLLSQQEKRSSLENQRELPSIELIAALDTEGNFVTYEVVEVKLVYLRNTINKFARTDITRPA
jgi:hypothetical protein